MSHPLVAAAWEQLSRHDIANILREIVGEHAAELAVVQIQDGLVSNIEPLTRMVFWIRTIFDLQRTYLQGMASPSDCHPYIQPYLLSSDIIYATLMYLVRVKTELFPKTTATIRESAQYRYFLAQTLLSGVRLLLLRGEDLDDERKSNLESGIRVAWRHPGLSDAEHYLVNDILPRAIDRIGFLASLDTGTSAWTTQEPVLPSFVSGLHLVHITPKTLVRDALPALDGDNESGMGAFWTLFDTLWAAEAAAIQCQVDRRRLPQDAGPSSKARLKVEEVSAQTEETRRALGRIILSASGESNAPSLQIISSIILSQCSSEPPSIKSSRVQEDWLELHNIRSVSDSALGHLMRWLINRRVQLWDCNGELEAVSQEYQQNLAQWLHDSSKSEPQGQPRDTEKRSTTVYLVDCPSMHPVPRTRLEEILRTGDKEVYKALLEDPQLLTLNITCPHCPPNTRVQHARMIEPLTQLSNALNIESESSLGRQSHAGSDSRRVPSRSSSTSHSSAQVETGEPLKIVTPQSTSTSASSKLASSHTMNTTIDSLASPLTPATSARSPEPPRPTKSLSKEFKSVKASFSSRKSSFRRPSSGRHPLPVQPQFCFSASGNSLLLWEEDGNWIMRFDMPDAEGQPPHSHRYDVSGVQCAAAGDRGCAAIASVGEHYELLVFEGVNITASASLTIDAQRRSFPAICMVMSRDDEYLAFTLRDQVHVYRLGTRAIQRVMLDGYVNAYPMSGGQPVTGSRSRRPLNAKEIAQEEQRKKSVIERKVQFSPEGQHLIVATHFGNQYAYIDVWDCSVEPWQIAPGNSRFFKLPPWTTNDGDLTCVFYDSTRALVFLGAFLGKDYPILFSMSDNDLTSDPFSTRILHAAQSPSGDQIAVANGMNEIYLCGYKSNKTLNPCRMKKAAAKINSSAFKPGQLILSVPQTDHLLAFWVKGEKLMLRTVKMRDGNENVSDFDLRSDFDALAAMRPPAAGLQFQPRRPSLTSRPVAEMEGSGPGFMPRPRLPELPSGD